MAILIMGYTEGTGVPGTLLSEFLVTTGLFSQERLVTYSNDDVGVFRMHDRSTSLDFVQFKGDKYNTTTGANAGSTFDIYLNNITAGYTLRSAALLSDDTGVRYTTDARLNSGPSWYQNVMSYGGAGAIHTHSGEEELLVYSDSNDNIVTISDDSRNVFLNGSGTAAWQYPSNLFGLVSEIDNNGNIYFYSNTLQIVKYDWATGTSSTAYPTGKSIYSLSNQLIDIAGDGSFAVFVSDEQIIYKYTFATSQLSPLITFYEFELAPRKIKLTQDSTKLCVLSGTISGSNMRVFSI